MATYYAKRSLEILREEGPVELLKKITVFLFQKLDPKCDLNFRLQTLMNHLDNRIRYNAPPDPYNTLNVLARDIEYRVGVNSNGKRAVNSPRISGVGQIKKGNWDTYCRNVTDSYKIQGMIQRFDHGKEWKDTDYYKHIDKRECGNIDDYVESRFKPYERLYKNIRKEGYQRKHKGKTLRNNSEPIESHLEVLVSINRHGNFYLFGGYHRFSIAHILDIKIPVQVVCRHKKWQKLRDEIHNNGLPEGREDLCDHPDLQDILD